MEVPYDDSLTAEQALLPDVCSRSTWTASRCRSRTARPLRLVMPQMYGYKSVKWVTRIEVRTDVLPGYWEQRGYDTDAWLGRSNGLG